MCAKTLHNGLHNPSLGAVYKKLIHRYRTDYTPYFLFVIRGAFCVYLKALRTVSKPVYELP